MYRLQVFNWGTFSGLHDIAIAERGFLFVGRSGAGKSTLLDAFSALLVPPKWVDFNAAAREAERTGRDRNLVTYIRGAWAEQKDSDSGEIAKQYLRTGTAWSALALHYRNTNGKAVTLVQIFWLRGNSNANADTHRHYLIAERSFDLRVLEGFDLNIRKFKQTFADVYHSDEFKPYFERFSRLLGIESEMALKLLHKTQSAKNLGDLNTFLRDFMLDKPPTFDVANRLVSEFSELNAAHQAVVTAREQVETIAPARTNHEYLQETMQKHNALDEIRLGVDAYKEMRHISLLEAHIADLNVLAEGATGEVQHRQALYENDKAALQNLQQQHRDQGGDHIEQLETEKKASEKERDERIAKRDRIQQICRALGWPPPESPQTFAERAARARNEIADWQSQAKKTRGQHAALAVEKSSAETEFATAVREVNALKRQPSNIDANMLDLRTCLTQALALPESALPFAGELLQVHAREAVWQGAIERVLRGFALSLLVEERHYNTVSNYINATHLGGRLEYFRLGQTDAAPIRIIPANSLVNKLQIKDGSYSTWLKAELTRRFDYACVDNLQAFRNTERAMTREGQVRHGKSRHGKDDRHRIDDRSRWVLGFDNHDKLALFEQKAQALGDNISQLHQAIDALIKADQQRAERITQCQTLADSQWHDIDVGPSLDRIANIDRLLIAARQGNTALQRLDELIKKQEAIMAEAEQRLIEAKASGQKLATDIEKQEKLLAPKRAMTPVALTPHQHQGLVERFAALNEPLTLNNLDNLAHRVDRTLGVDLKTLAEAGTVLSRTIEDCFANFKRRWPMESADLDASLAATADFLAKLQRLETDGLPDYEHRFFELLRTQSDQNLAELATHLNQARKAILERMELVNESLSQAPFNVGTHLHIDASDRQLLEVREFKREIQQALSNAWSEVPDEAEARFVVMRGIVERLASQEPEQRHWRETVLDVRQHVEFIGRELDENKKEIEIYRSGAGKSGGQRQKLATTCLAAALRYQLGGSDSGVPLYAPVILDEAFDKADNEFTALAMNIFTNFGFQMIVATPLKSVMTLEPFIGGACFVDIKERRHSGVLLIEYDHEQQRLKRSKHLPFDDSVAVS